MKRLSTVELQPVPRWLTQRLFNFHRVQSLVDFVDGIGDMHLGEGVELLRLY